MTAFMRMKELLDTVGMSRSALYDRISPTSPRFDPDFPKPVKINPSLKQEVLRWSRREVDEWLTKMGAEKPKPRTVSDAERDLERLRDAILCVNRFFEDDMPITGREDLRDLARSIEMHRKYFSHD